MPAHRLSNPGLPDRANHHHLTYRANAARCDSHAAAGAARDASEGANANPRAPSPRALLAETLAYHKALGGTGSSRPQATSQPGCPPGRHGCIRRGSGGADDVHDYRDQRRRAVPINLAFRLGNRSNGEPLATITEQGSYSTLGSRGSLLNAGPFSSLRVVENISPSRTSPKASPSFEERALQLNAPPKSDQQERVLGPTTQAYYKPSYQDIGNLSPLDETTLPSLQTILDRPKHIPYQPGEIDCDGNSRSVKGLVREVLHNVRAVSRTRSKSSSTHTPLAEDHENRAKTGEDGPIRKAPAFETLRSDNSSLNTPPGELLAPLDVTQLSAPEYESKDARTLTAEAALSARLDFPSSKELRYPLSSHAQPVVTQSPKPSTVTPVRQRQCSIRLVKSEPRAVLQAGCCSDASGLADHNANPNQKGSVYYSASASSNASLSLTEVDRAEDAIPNTISSSTLSTSYSGTVVGVDVDLQHEFPHTTRHSRSSTPVAPVWFTPRTRELQQQTSISDYSKAKQGRETKPRRQSITSAALTTLLPIAAASGIVCPNYKTPQISFFSPSGSLIQPEDYSTPGTTSASDSNGSPTVVTSKCRTPAPASYSMFPATCLPPPRPSLRPMTTPPTTSVPLPPNLRHHHNYKRPEKAQINPETACIHSLPEHGPAVKGCGGGVRTSTLPACAQRHRSYEKTKTRPQHKRHRSARLFRKDIRLGVRFRKARLIAAITASCKTPRKGTLRGEQNAATKGASMPRKRKRAAAATFGKKHIHTRHARQRHNTGLVGPVAGHVLRVCFCQPYDGAGKPTHDVAAKALCMGNYVSDMHENPNEESLPVGVTDRGVVDAVLPNARVVTGVNRKINSTSSTHKRMSVRREQGIPTTRL